MRNLISGKTPDGTEYEIYEEQGGMMYTLTFPEDEHPGAGGSIPNLRLDELQGLEYHLRLLKTGEEVHHQMKKLFYQLVSGGA